MDMKIIKLTKEQKKVFKNIEPEMLWDILNKNDSNAMAKSDYMLKNGMSPEWIANNPPLDTAPEELRDMMIRCLKWRAEKLNIIIS